MNKEIKEILNDNNINLTIKGYQEMPSTEGFHMSGLLYVNNQKAIAFEDLGFGGGMDYKILNQENANPLLNIQTDIEKIKPYKEMPGINYTINTLIYESIEEYLQIKEIKRYVKKGILVKEEEQIDKNNIKIYPKEIINQIFEEMKQNKKGYYIWDNKKESWIGCKTVEEAKKVIKQYQTKKIKTTRSLK